MHATGGYKVPGVVAQADLWQVGQMRPGDTLSFEAATAEEATAALGEMRAVASFTKHIGVEFSTRETTVRGVLFLAFLFDFHVSSSRPADFDSPSSSPSSSLLSRSQGPFNTKWVDPDAAITYMDI